MKLLSFLIVTIFLISGCENNKNVKVLNQNFIDTKVGTIHEKKLQKEIIVVVKKMIPKVVKKVIVKKPKNKVNITVVQKKLNFINTLEPIVTKVHNDLQSQYLRIKNDIKNDTNHEEIKKLRLFYELKKDDDLLHSLKPHPISIVLAQAAIESAWLTSRFTLEANNIFGVWSFNKKEPRIAASGLRGDKTIYLKKYKSLTHAVKDYYKNLGRNWAYKTFREQRTKTNNPYDLVLHLGSYSEKEEVYTKMLQRMIEYNKFDKFDINGTF